MAICLQCHLQDEIKPLLSLFLAHPPISPFPPSPVIIGELRSVPAEHMWLNIKINVGNGNRLLHNPNC